MSDRIIVSKTSGVKFNPIQGKDEAQREEKLCGADYFNCRTSLLETNLFGPDWSLTYNATGLINKSDSGLAKTMRTVFVLLEEW